MQPPTEPRNRVARRPGPAVLAALAVALIALIAVLVLAGRLSSGPRGTGALATASGPTASSTTAPSTTVPSTMVPATGEPASGATSAPSSPATPDATATAAPALLVAAGDIGRCDATTDDDTGALAAGLPGAVAILGDTAYPTGSRRQLRDCFGGSWGAVTARIRFAVTGNHDDMTDRGAPLIDYLGEAAARDGHTYFSDDLGAWHVVVLDADCDVVPGGCGRSSPQVRWLRADLAASTARCTIALWHQPRFSSGQHGGARETAPFWDALYAAGAELVLNGHDHDYERFAPQDPSGHRADKTGITEIVVGTGGGELRPFRDQEPHSLVRSSEAYGVLALTLSDGAWATRFVATTPGFSDEASGTCH